MQILDKQDNYIEKCIPNKVMATPGVIWILVVKSMVQETAGYSNESVVIIVVIEVIVPNRSSI